MEPWDLRMKALELASLYTQDADQVIINAKKYIDFITGQQPTNQS